MRVRFLGTGTSFGVPVIGCSCRVCRSADPRDARTRHGLLIEDGDRRLLVDTPPELRLQLVRERVERIDAVFLSHEHADHTHGIDDLRIFTLRMGRALPFFVAREFVDELRSRFSYVWGKARKSQPGSVVPRLEIRSFEDREEIEAAGLAITPIAFPHGVYRSYGFRTGELAVIVDAKSVPPDAEALLRGARVLIVNALWFGDPHPGHFSIEEAVETGKRLGAERTYLTHLAHRATHAEIEERLPDGAFAAHDGLVIEV